MKKILYIAGLSLLALQAGAASPQKLRSEVISTVSADGMWAAGSLDPFIMSIIDLRNDTKWQYGEAFRTSIYSVGFGHAISNQGVVVASQYETELPYQWRDGKWSQLPILSTDFGAYPNAVTPDSRYIAGSVMHDRFGSDAVGTLTGPALWAMNDRGGYDMYTALPMPPADWTGRTPQMVIIDDISDDGRTLAGFMLDYMGIKSQPMVYSLGDDGQWQYKLLQPQLLNPDGVEFPPFPGQEPDQPNPADYMTAEEQDLYQVACVEFEDRKYPEPEDFVSEDAMAQYLLDLAAYNEDWVNNPIPSIYDYMTEEEENAYFEALNSYYIDKYPNPKPYMTAEEYAQYQAAYELYTQQAVAWAGYYTEFEDVMISVLSNPKTITFSMNSIRISPNGKYVVMNAEYNVRDSSSDVGYRTVLTPFLFDVQADTYTILDSGATDVYATQVTDNGTVLGGAPAVDYIRDAVIAGEDGKFVPVSEYVKDANPELYAWMQENATQEGKVMLGTPMVSADMSMMVSWNYNVTTSDYESFIIPLDGVLSGLGRLMLSDINVAVKADRIVLSGNVERLCVYDIRGMSVLDIEQPATSVHHQLPHGLYIIKAVGADGRAVVTRAAI